MFKIFNASDEPIDFKIWKFPAGECGVSIDIPDLTSSIRIQWRWLDNEEFITLALLVDAIRKQISCMFIVLDIPYFPYARQDRVCNKGESLSLKVVAEMINSLKFNKVIVLDPHSEVLGAVLNNMVTFDLSLIVQGVMRMSSSNVLVSPDAGANKKVFGYAKSTPWTVDMVRADKTRDTRTGAITGTVVYSEHLGDRNVLVVDDILDGGGTFIPLAAELRKITNGTVNLLVSHGLFTKGIDIFEGVYDNIFVINNMFAAHPLIKEI